MTKNIPLVPVVEEIPEPQCVICGGREFVTAPGGRTYRGVSPVCTGCGSLERHRVGYKILTQLDEMAMRDLVAIQFSRDPLVRPGSFRNLDYSVFGYGNSYDIQNIALPNGAYDVSLCSHVLEHVPDDVSAIRELCRITSRRGFVFLMVPNPAERKITVDWGYPDPKQHDHYRIYGEDIGHKIAQVVPRLYCVLVKEVDAVTGRVDVAYLISEQRKWHDYPIKAGLRARSVNIPSDGS